MLIEHWAVLENLGTNQFDKLPDVAKKNSQSMKMGFTQSTRADRRADHHALVTIEIEQERNNHNRPREKLPPVPFNMEELNALIDQWHANGTLKVNPNAKKPTKEEKHDSHFHHYVQHPSNHELPIAKEDRTPKDS
ncbi:hypothetical protein CCACVL1_11860 [Corchorus capsularis]|uniref:Uncharacterized protein n=1 Tax=Corchorus capsularis TaxID=210143 RepID=A0A1R3IJ45_COCAP|nr:hypothetical protein CCACVL1_11860 [Corchorus capsularis]